MPGTHHSVCEKVRFGPFEADLQTRELRKFGIRIKLQDQPFKLLATLLKSAGEIVSRSDLQRQIWGKDVVVDFDQSLGTAVNKVREALGDSAENPRYIETISRRGYRFIAPVGIIEPTKQSIAEMEISPDVRLEATGAPSIVPPTAAAPGPHSSLHRSYWSIVAVCTLVALLGLVRMFSPSGTSRPTVRFTAVTSSDSVYPGEANYERFSGVATDGVRIYFSEMRKGRLTLASSSISGGEVQSIPTPPEISRPIVADISPDGARLLVRNLIFSDLEEPLWIVPSSGGIASRVLAGPGHDAAWLPDGQSIVYASGHNLLITRNNGGPSKKLATLPGRAFAIRYAPNGSRLRFTLLNSATHARSLWELSADGRKLRPLLRGWRSPSDECCGSWTPDGRYFIFQLTENDTTDIWALPENHSLGRTVDPIQVTAGPLNYRSAVPAIRGKRLFVIGSQARNQLVRVDAASHSWAPWPTDVKPRRISFSLDGRFMAWTGIGDNILRRASVDGSQRLLLTSPPMRAYRISWSPDGRHIAFDGDEPGHPTKIYIASVNGGAPAMLLNENRNETDPTWSPDGKSILFGRLPEYLGEDSADKAIYVVDVQSKKVSTIPGSVGLFSPRWSPDGRYIVAMPLNQEKLMIFDTSAKNWTEVSAPGVTSPVWSADSKFVYFKARREESLYRLTISADRLERVGGIEDVRPADLFRLVGLTPNNEPLLLSTVQSADIYAVDWDPQ